MEITCMKNAIISVGLIKFNKWSVNPVQPRMKCRSLKLLLPIATTRVFWGKTVQQNTRHTRDKNGG
jgi:hypothetical protein